MKRGTLSLFVLFIVLFIGLIAACHAEAMCPERPGEECEMSQMGLSAVRVIDPILTTHAQGYRQAQHIAEALFPRVPVEVSGGQVLQFGKEAFRQYNLRRAPGTATKRLTFGYLGRPYALVQDSAEVPVPREHLRDAQAGPGVDLGQNATQTAMASLLLSLEREAADLATDPDNYDGSHKATLAEANRWSQEDVDPQASLDAGREAVRASVGLYPNVLVLGAAPWNALRRNPYVLDRIKYTNLGVVSAELVAQLFEFDKVVVGKAVSATDAGVMSDIWGNFAVMAYVPPAPSGMQEPSYGYTYVMRGHPLVEQAYYEQASKSWIYGASFERAPVLAGMSAGYLISTPA
jgi:hypothetical protein